jgi:hypothetical protein
VHKISTQESSERSGRLSLISSKRNANWGKSSLDIPFALRTIQRVKKPTTLKNFLNLEITSLTQRSQSVISLNANTLTLILEMEIDMERKIFGSFTSIV